MKVVRCYFGFESIKLVDHNKASLINSPVLKGCNYLSIGWVFGFSGRRLLCARHIWLARQRIYNYTYVINK